MQIPKKFRNTNSEVEIGVGFRVQLGHMNKPAACTEFALAFQIHFPSYRSSEIFERKIYERHACKMKCCY